MFNFLNTFKAVQLLTLITLVNVAVVACSKNNSNEDSTIIAQSDPIKVEGAVLGDVAGKAALPMQVESAETSTGSISVEEQKFVGRYKVTVSCNDKFAGCESGESEFIINLLPDGIAHRVFMHKGKVEFGTKHRYRKDRWSYDQSSNHIILHRERGLKIYYTVDSKGNLKMDLQKNANASEINREFFKKNPLPTQAYVLKRVK